MLHFIGHGTYDTDTDEGVLAFVGRDGAPTTSPHRASPTCSTRPSPRPRLVVLNSVPVGRRRHDPSTSSRAPPQHCAQRHPRCRRDAVLDQRHRRHRVRPRLLHRAGYGRGIDEAVRSGRIGILGIGGARLVGHARALPPWRRYPPLRTRGPDAPADAALVGASAESKVPPRRARPSRMRHPPRSTSPLRQLGPRWKPWLVGGGIALAAVAGADHPRVPAARDERDRRLRRPRDEGGS